MMMGMNAASTTVFSSTVSKAPIMARAATPPIQLASSQGKRVLAFSYVLFRRISRSSPAPAIFSISSVAATFLTNGFLVGMLFMLPFLPGVWMIFVTALFIKLLTEYVLYLTSLRPLQRSMNHMDFLLWFILQAPYILAMGLASFFARQQGWQGRK